MVNIISSRECCLDLGAVLPKQNGQVGMLSNLSIFTMPNVAQILLLPPGEGCVAVIMLRATG